MSQCDRIYAVLRDRQPHRMEEIHQRVGFCRLNSRIAELRSKRGLNIVCDKTGGTYTYRLLGAFLERDPQAGRLTVPPAGAAASTLLDAVSSRSESAPVQLTLEAA